MSEALEAEAVPPSPLDPRFVADPEAVYGPIRAETPVWWWEGGHAWLVTRYDAFVETLRHPDVTMDFRLWEHHQPATDPVAVEMEKQMDVAIPFMPKDAHDRVRRLVSRAFTPRAVAALEPMIRNILNELIDDVRPRGAFDAVSDITQKYPTRVISRMIGIPPDSEREVLFKQYSDIFIASVSPLISSEERNEIGRVQAKFMALVTEVIDEHRANPRDDMLSALIEVEEEGERLSIRELQALIFGLIMAGSETTANAVGIGLFTLLTHPEQLAAFRDDPGCRDNAVLELLRFHGPGYHSSRVALRDLEIAGVPVRKGQLVLAGILASHWDPDAFADPLRLDFDRDLREQSVFGSGEHFCLGAQLARLELLTAYTTLFDALPELRLTVPASEIGFRAHPTIRGVESLPLAF